LLPVVRRGNPMRKNRWYPQTRYTSYLFLSVILIANVFGFDDDPVGYMQFEIHFADVYAVQDLPGQDSFLVSTSRGLRIYNFNNGSSYRTVTNTRNISSMNFAVDAENSRIAVYDQSQSTVEIRDAVSFQLIGELIIPDKTIFDIAFGYNAGEIILSASDVRTFPDFQVIENAHLVVYDLDTKIESMRFNNAGDLVDIISVSQNGKQIFLRNQLPGYDSYDFVVIDKDTGLRRNLREAWYILPAYSQNTDIVALGVTLSLGITDEFEYLVEVWDLQTETQICSVPISPNPNRIPFTGLDRVSALALNSNGSMLAVGDDDGMVSIWDAYTCSLLSLFRVYYDKVEQLIFAHDDAILLSLNADKSSQTIRAWLLE